MRTCQKLIIVYAKVCNLRFVISGSGGKVNLRLDLPYTRAVIQEAFRVQTSTPLSVPRRTLQDINLMGYHIPKNTQVNNKSSSEAAEELNNNYYCIFFAGDSKFMGSP